MLEADLVAAALHPQQVTARGISLIVCAANWSLALVALALLGGALGQRLRQLEHEGVKWAHEKYSLYSLTGQKRK